MVDKLALMNRLRYEGRWAEASEFRVAKIKELRVGGMARAAAKEEAWRLMAIKYPPPLPSPAGPVAVSDAEEEPLDEVTSRRLSELFEKRLGVAWSVAQAAAKSRPSMSSSAAGVWNVATRRERLSGWRMSWNQTTSPLVE